MIDETLVTSGLVAAADVAVASRSADFGFTEARLGILPAIISPYVLRKLSPRAAQALILPGSRVDAERALQLGLVQVVVDPGELDDAVQQVIAE